MQNLNTIYTTHLQDVEKQKWIIKENIDKLKSISSDIIIDYEYNKYQFNNYEFIYNIKKNLIYKKDLISHKILENVKSLKYNENISDLEKKSIKEKEKLSIIKNSIEQGSL